MTATDRTTAMCDALKALDGIEYDIRLLGDIVSILSEVIENIPAGHARKQVGRAMSLCMVANELAGRVNGDFQHTYFGVIHAAIQLEDAA